MNLTEIAVLLPCHSLDDFPLYYEGDAAEGLLSAWSCLWHPALIASAHRVPAWHRIDSPPADLSGRLIAVPPVCRDQLPADFQRQAKEQAAVIVDDCWRHDELLDRLLSAMEQPASATAALQRDFLALGFCRLQVELLTRQMRYSSHIDELQFNSAVLGAATSAVRGDEEAAAAQLAEAFELLYEARKYYYPVDAYLIDYTLLAPTTLGPGLSTQLETYAKCNLLASADLLRTLRAGEQATWTKLTQALVDQRVCIVGGEPREAALPLLPLESIHDHFTAGLKGYTELLGQRPLVFGRRTYGLTPILPQILSKFGFKGALHFTLDDGQFPLGQQGKISWEGLDGSTIDAIARVPRDASKPESFATFARRMADSMDSDHVATLMFAHWPGMASHWYDHLLRIAELSPVLGKLVTLDEYFAQTESPGRLTKFSADEYRAPYLRQTADEGGQPLSSFAASYADRAQHDAACTVRSMQQVVSGLAQSTESSQGDRHSELASALSGFTHALGGGDDEPSSILAVNPLSFSRRLCIPLGGSIEDTNASTDACTVSELPGMGFIWLEPEPQYTKRVKPIAEGNVLRNDYLEVRISESTGGIESIHAPGLRGNRLSQQLALRLSSPHPTPAHSWRNPDEDAAYSTVRLESVKITAASTTRGVITASGSLVDQNAQEVAHFTQQVELLSGSRVAELRIDLETLRAPADDPWLSYYASRFAWSEAATEVSRNVGLATVSTEAKRIEAPLWIEITAGTARTAILTAGLPYHRRVAPRRLDTLLVTRGENCRSFKLAVGIDLPNPAAAALEVLAPATIARGRAPASGTPSGWLFHIDARNVIATAWEAIGQPTPAAADGSALSGFRVRLVETAGRSGPIHVRGPRRLSTARIVDFQGQTLLDLAVEDDKIPLDIAAHEYLELEAHWA